MTSVKNRITDPQEPGSLCQKIPAEQAADAVSFLVPAADPDPDPGYRAGARSLLFWASPLAGKFRGSRASPTNRPEPGAAGPGGEGRRQTRSKPPEQACEAGVPSDLQPSLLLDVFLANASPDGPIEVREEPVRSTGRLIVDGIVVPADRLARGDYTVASATVANTTIAVISTTELYDQAIRLRRKSTGATAATL
ncbi:hypothetical protein ACFVVL_27580 [Kitasatospora sp. NPDC058115]|uniref:hypothetical protein n=1 Tax=Kitasatospora sp. NPDC058115 TaxID=3346347 RepID=UPI0036DDC9A7